jgi:hypothetical protein
VLGVPKILVARAFSCIFVPAVVTQIVYDVWLLQVACLTWHGARWVATRLLPPSLGCQTCPMCGCRTWLWGTSWVRGHQERSSMVSSHYTCGRQRWERQRKARGGG